MPSSTLPRASFEHRRRLLALWSGIMAGPLVWAVLLQTNYVLSYVACEQGHTWMLHLATGIALVLIAAAAAVAWRAAAPLDALGERADARFDPDRIGLLRFMAVGGLGLCAWFAIVILATELPALVLHPCTP
jgi:putative flippase GtrA